VTKTRSTKRPTYFEQIPVALVKQLLLGPTPPLPNDATTRATDAARMRNQATAAAERSVSLQRDARAAQDRVKALRKKQGR